MATYYVNSAATGANTGASWADAFVSFWSLPALASADNVYVASTHDDAGGGGGSKILVLPASGECAYIISVIAGTTTAQPGALIRTIAATGGLTFDGAMYVNGLVFEPLNVATFIFIADTNESGVLSRCTFRNAPAGTVVFNGVSTVGCTIDLIRDSSGASRSIMQVASVGGTIQHIGMSIINATNRTGTSSCVVSAVSSPGAGVVQYIGCDFSNVPSSCELYEGGAAGLSVELHNCRTSATFTVLRTALTARSRWAMYNTGHDNVVANSTDNVVVLGGNITTVFDQVNVPPDCAQSNDGLGNLVKYYWSILGIAMTVNRGAPIVTDWIYAYVQPGTYTVTINVEAALFVPTPLRVYLQVDYLGSASNQKYSTFITPGAGVLAEPYPAGPAWGGSTNDSYNIAAPSLVVAQAGLIRARIFYASPAGYTVNVNPKLILT
jgi:hypothetical protein